ncbi:hypothetical protein V8Z69_07475 [Microbacterium aurugineum]|uniref:hypothetical protein n=1 Tax=Microbacterium aurugineum TaxID=2851642 RepID=UPI0039BE119E
MNKVFNSKVRKWLYGVCIAAVPVLVYFKLLPPEASPIILPLVLAVLNVNETDTERPE